MHLDIAKPRILEKYLQEKQWLAEGEIITHLEKPGEGNMNYTLRVRTPTRTFIIKQARPYVEKYPQIAAPADRAVVEGQFYQKIREYPALSEWMPQLLGMDFEHKILVLEDLGTANDYTTLYRPNCSLALADARALVQFIAQLHHQTHQPVPDEAFANRAMRALNHEHIFHYPFLENNGFDLDHVTEGLQMVSMAYKFDNRLKKHIHELGQVYLADGTSLLHGDYYPGSWLQTQMGVKIIDPEFCFYGPPEFDLGVMTAHLMMAKQSEATIKTVYEAYGRVQNPDLVDHFTGVEIMRRLIGIAQLPLSLSLLDKEELLEQAYEMVMK